MSLLEYSAAFPHSATYVASYFGVVQEVTSVSVHSLHTAYTDVRIHVLEAQVQYHLKCTEIPKYYSLSRSPTYHSFNNPERYKSRIQRTRLYSCVMQTVQPTLGICGISGLILFYKTLIARAYSCLT